MSYIETPAGHVDCSGMAAQINISPSRFSEKLWSAARRNCTGIPTITLRLFWPKAGLNEFEDIDPGPARKPSHY
jgi:hypothetical protein